MTNYPPPDPGQGSGSGSQGGSQGGPPWGQPPSVPPGKTKFAGLDANVAAMICYLPICLNLIVAVIFFITERELRFVRFHAAQSLILFGAWIIVSVGLTIIGAVPGLGFIVGSVIYPLTGLAGFVLYIYLAMKAYNNAWYKLPTIGDLADRLTGG